MALGCRALRTWGYGFRDIGLRRQELWIALPPRVTADKANELQHANT